MPIVVGDSQICIALTSARRAKASKNDVDVNESISVPLSDGDVEGLFAGRRHITNVAATNAHQMLMRLACIWVVPLRSAASRDFQELAHRD